jgi:hypothetical protein
MTVSLESGAKENCPVLKTSCSFYSYQCDRNGEVVVCFCSHPDNPKDVEGNCLASLCPITFKNRSNI